MEKVAPQLQVVGVFLSPQSYLKQIAFQNSPLCRWKPCSVSGRAVSHEEEPLSVRDQYNTAVVVIAGHRCSWLADPGAVDSRFV